MRLNMVINSYNKNFPPDIRQSPETGLIQQILPIQSGTILDIGCGCGKQSIVLATNNNKVLGLDIQDWMINYAKENNSNENTTYLCEDFMTYDFKDSQYNIIISQNVFFHIKDKETLLRKIYDLLKIGGSFYFTDLTQHNTEHSDENLAYPVSPNYYTKVLNDIGFSNVLFLWEKHWIWNGMYSGKNFCMFKCNK